MNKYRKLIDLATQINPLKSPSDLQPQNPSHVIVKNTQLYYYGKKENIQEQKKQPFIKVYVKKSLPKIIVFCYFVNLKQLYINQSHIDNVEWTGFLNAPKLKFLFIGSNQITNFKSFTKLKLPQLEMMSIIQNYAPQICLERMDLSQKIQSLILQNRNQNQIIVQDLKKLVKLNPQCIQRIVLQMQRRIKQTQVKQKLQQKLYQKFTTDFGTFGHNANIIDEYEQYNHWNHR